MADRTDWAEMSNMANYAYKRLDMSVGDHKSSGTDGGSAVATTWNIRSLNTLHHNYIEDASLASNQITLPAGEYHIYAHAPAHAVNGHKLSLYNITDSTHAVIGTSAYAPTGHNVTSLALISEHFSITSQKVFELRHYTETANAGDGLGHAVGIGSIEEAYAQVEIVRVGNI